MKLRTFTAPDVPTAMKMVREAMGDDAIILSSHPDKIKRTVTITAALEAKEEPLPMRPPPPSASSLRSAAAKPSPAASEDWLDDLSYLLRFHSVPEALAGRLIYRARNLELDKIFALQRFSPNESRSPVEQKALARLLSEVFRFDPLPVHETALRLMVVGPPGAGKTLAVAKLATQMAMKGGKLTVITTDTRRAGGIEQLSAFTDILRVPLAVAESPAELASILRELSPGARALIDTAGCNPYAREDLNELTAFICVDGFEPVLALPAGMDGLEAVDAVRSFAFPAIRRMLITRADAARRFGSLLASADAGKLSLSNISDSPRVAEELTPAEPARLAQRMLRYRNDNTMIG